MKNVVIDTHLSNTETNAILRALKTTERMYRLKGLSISLEDLKISDKNKRAVLEVINCINDDKVITHPCFLSDSSLQSKLLLLCGFSRIFSKTPLLLYEPSDIDSTHNKVVSFLEKLDGCGLREIYLSRLNRGCHLNYAYQDAQSAVVLTNNSYVLSGVAQDADMLFRSLYKGENLSESLRADSSVLSEFLKYGVDGITKLLIAEMYLTDEEVRQYSIQILEKSHLFLNLACTVDLKPIVPLEVLFSLDEVDLRGIRQRDVLKSVEETMHYKSVSDFVLENWDAFVKLGIDPRLTSFSKLVSYYRETICSSTGGTQ